MKRVSQLLAAALARLPGVRSRAERAEANGRHFAAMLGWRRLASRGDAEAGFRIGRFYENGRGVVRDPIEAAHWYRQAAERGFSPAQLQLGRLLINGARAPLPAQRGGGDLATLFPRGVELAANPAEAIAMLTAAAESGETAACAILGALYFEGRKTGRDLAKARHWYARGAAARDASAQFGLADLLFNAPDGEADPAAEEYEKAAAQGHTRAQTAMGYLCQHGLGRTRDLVAAGAWYRRAAEGGDLHALDAAARMHLSGEGLASDARQAEAYLRRAAKRGYLPSMIALADFYEFGAHAPVDLREAAHWRRMAGEAGHVDSQFRAAHLFDAGLGDPDEAARLYASAAGAHHALAAFHLGALIANHPAHDASEALPWYLQAAEGGVREAAARLGDLYLDESLAIHDAARGAEWLAKAAATDPKAKARHALIQLKTSDEAAVRAEAERVLAEVASPEVPDACYALGELHARGLARRCNPAEALRWFALAARGGHIEARYVLAMAMVAQRGDPDKLAGGAAALRELAEAGHTDAQFQVGVLLSGGAGLAADLGAAVEWFRKASDAGHALAQYNLGVMLTQGLGTPADVAEGLTLIRLAAEKGVVPKQSSAA